MAARALWFVCVVLAMPRTADAQQQAAIHYVYDELNRLIAVIDQQGNAATYTYDAVGNILRIQRFDGVGIPGAVAITLVSPTKGKVGTTVQIFGKGFSATPSQNSVVFGGALAHTTASAANRIVTSVPDAAVTGPITVTSPLGSATSPTSFRVPGAVTVSPIRVTVFTRRTQSFVASEIGNSPASVIWSVNGVVDGDGSVGTISTEGVYTAPTAIPSPPTVTVTATNREDDRLSGSATVTIEAAPDVLVLATPVGVQLVAPSADTTVTTAISAHVPRPFAFVVSPAASGSVTPVITALSPTSAARGATLVITIAGTGFAAATGLTFLRNNTADTNITATDLNINADGTQATASISIAPGAALGARVVQITTPDGTATRVGTGGNAFTVQ